MKPRHVTTAVSHLKRLTTTLIGEITCFESIIYFLLFTSCCLRWTPLTGEIKKYAYEVTFTDNSRTHYGVNNQTSTPAYVYFRRYLKRHEYKIHIHFRIVQKINRALVFASTVFLNTRWRCGPETTLPANIITKADRQDFLLLLTLRLSHTNHRFNQHKYKKLKMSRRISTRGRSSSRGITRGAAVFNTRSSTTPLTLRARKIDPIADKIYKLPIEMSLINGSEVYLYGKKADGGLQLPSSTRIGTTRYVYDESPKRFDTNGDLLPSTGTVFTIIYRFKADQASIIKGAIQQAKEAGKTMFLPKNLTDGLTTEKDGWSYCIKDLDTKVADTIKYVSLPIKNIKDIPDVEAPGGSKYIKKAIQEKGLDVSSNVYLQTHNNLSRVQIPTGAIYFWSRDLPDENFKKDGKFPLTNIPVNFQTIDPSTGFFVNNTVMLKIRPVPPKPDIERDERLCKVCDRKGHYTWECPRVLPEASGACAFPSSSERLPKDFMSATVEDFPELQRPKSANAWRGNTRTSSATQRTTDDKAAFIKDLTETLLAMNAVGNSSEDDIKQAVEKCVNAEREQSENDDEAEKAAEKIVKKLKGEFVFHGLKPLYTVDDKSVLIDDIAHRGWDKFSAQVWGFNVKNDDSIKSLAAFKPLDSDNDSKEWKPKFKRSTSITIHLIRTLSWSSLQTKKFERRDLLVTALTEPVGELQKIFQCEVSRKESYLEEWLGIGDVETYSWTSKPGCQDPKAKAAYAIIACLEKVLGIDVNDVAMQEDFTTINNRRYGKKEDKQM